jgi:lysophospholipase L1-like esterase
MRRLLVIAILGLAVAAVVAWRSTRDSGDPSIAAPPVSAVTLVGDSLNVGVEPYLRALLPGWSLSMDDVVGRPTAIGVERVRAAGASLAPYVVISLGTNDQSTAVDQFRDFVSSVLGVAGPHRCVVWPSIYKRYERYDGFNDVLARMQSVNLQVVDWAGMLVETPSLLAPDGVHGSPDGYRARAEAIVEAMARCHASGVT